MTLRIRQTWGTAYRPKLRSVDPTCEIKDHGSLFAGNAAQGELIFNTFPTDAGQPCSSCHALPFGAGGGQTGGVTPEQPTAPEAAALFNGDLDGSPHSDLKIPHTRNVHEKFGPVWAAPGEPGMPETVSGFGYIHDGGIPDVFRFLSASVFNLSAANQAQEVRDVAAFMFQFPSGTRPAVGRQVTLPPGMPPTGPPASEALLNRLIALGDASSADRHCELVASALSAGRLRSYRLDGGLWATDVADEAAVNTKALREAASGPLTFTCATIGSGGRLGGDRDEDTVLNGDDCAPADAETWSPAASVLDLELSKLPVTGLAWGDQGAVVGPSVRYDVLGGELSGLLSAGVATAGCLAPGLVTASHVDAQADPVPGDGHFYLIRAHNPCGVADMGPGREPLETLVCP